MDVLQALTPTVVAAIAFFAVVRAILRADRNERAAIARMESDASKNE